MAAPTNNLLNEWVGACSLSLKDNLLSVVLYGTGAEDKLRSTSDINLLFVVETFVPDQWLPLRELLRTATAVHKLRWMVLQKSELPQAAAAFAERFSDIQRRHKILFGSNLIDGLAIPRDRLIQRELDALLNLKVRTRNAFVSRSLRVEQLSAILAEITGPLRTAAATCLALQTGEVCSPKEALAQFLKTDSPQYVNALEQMSAAHRGEILGEVVASSALNTTWHIMDTLSDAFSALRTPSQTQTP